MKRLPVLALVAVCVFAQGSAKRPLTHQDSDSWRAIQSPTLSRDGRMLAYGLFPQEGDGELVVRDLRTGQERREPAGALPPPPEPSPDREPGDDPPPTTIRIGFTHDGRFVVFSTFPAKAEIEGAKKAKKDAPKNGLGMLDLNGKTPAVRVPDVRSFQIPEDGGAMVAYSKQPLKKETRPRRQEFGTEMVLRDLVKGVDRKFDEVLEYSLARDGKTLVYAVASAKSEGNGVYATATTEGAQARALLAGKGRYQKLTWDAKQTKLAFLSDREDADTKPSKPRVYLWPSRDGNESAREIVSMNTPGFRQGFTISERGQVGFSRDGSRLFFGAGLPVPERDETPAADDAVTAELWHFKDPYIQPMQKIRATQDRNRSYRAVYHLADGKLVQLADDSMAAISASDDGRYAIGSDDRAYRSMVDYDRLYTDYYLIDTVTGSRKRLLEKGEAGGGGMPPMYWSPDSRRVLFYRDRNWHMIEVTSGDIVNLTANLPVKFYDELDDRPAAPSSYGSAGWTQDSKWVLLYDRFDVWQISADGKTSRSLTDGLGRKEDMQFRVVRLEREEETGPRGIDPAKPLLLRAESNETRDSGFWRDRVEGTAAPEKLVMAPRNHRTVAKAKDADVVLYTASTFADFPDLRVTDSTFRDSKKVTDANPQKAGLTWGTAELVRFRNADGVPLKAALYKPDNFDPKKKYPMLIYIYERLSQNVNSFVDPKPGTSPNISFYVSNGYLVLTPDIVYSTGAPGQSAVKCVLPAIQEVVDRGGVDENAIGIAGHSWGGYQTAYLVTQTKRFRAAEAGAPVGNMTSAYNGIRWGSGLPRQFQYERAQSRIGGSLWEYPMQFFANSPVFHVPNVQTPLLLLHNDQDDAVPWYQGIELYLSLRRHGKEAYLFNYNGEKHGIRKRPNQKDWTVRMQQFFDYHLKGSPKPEWMEKGIPYIEREKAFAATGN